jgi:hypothetical protein
MPERGINNTCQNRNPFRENNNVAKMVQFLTLCGR